MKKLDTIYTKIENSLLQNTNSPKQLHIYLRNCKRDGREYLVWCMIENSRKKLTPIELRLKACSTWQATWNEFLQSLSGCKHLTHLDLSENVIGEAVQTLSQSIRSWGHKAALEKLWPYNCSLSPTASFLQSLSSCRQLTEVDLGGNKLGKSGHQLAQAIKSWGNEVPLQKLRLYNCSIEATASLELVRSLSTCRKLTALSLGENMLGEVGHELAQSIKSWGDEPQLKEL